MASASCPRPNRPDLGVLRGGTVDQVRTDAFDDGRLTRPGGQAVAVLADRFPFGQAFGARFSRLGRNERWCTLVADVRSEESPRRDWLHLQILPTVVVF